MKSLSILKVKVKRPLVNVFCLILIFPIKATIAIINIIRNLTKAKIINENIWIFRSKIQNELTKVIDSTYLIRYPVKSNIKLTYVDIGSRAGLPNLVKNNSGIFKEIILCEGEPKEAKKLREQGFLVIDKFLSEVEENATFFFNQGHPGASSLKRPGTPFLHLFSNKHYEIYTDYVEHDVMTSTLDLELSKLGINSIDYIKIDVQGSELSVIKGLTSIAPLFWEIEVLQLPIYQNTPYGVSISAELVNRGYICFRQNNRICKDGIFIFSNDLYMPNYTTDFGKALIVKNFDKWRTMIELFDINTLGRHIEDIIQ